MELSLSAAARTTGKGKSTLHRAIKTGKLSARRSEDGSYLIDTSELARVFQLNVPEQAVGTPREGWNGPVEPQGTELAVLRAEAAMLRDQLAREREAVAREQELVTGLLKRLDDEQAERRALQRQLTAPAQEQPQPTKQLGFLARLLGR